MAQIKINKALSKASVGRFPGTAHAMLDAVPLGVIGALTGAQLAELLDAMWGLANRSKAIACQDVIFEGAVWDSDRQKLREIAP